MKINLNKLHVKPITTSVLFQTPHVPAEALRDADEGIKILERFVTEMLEHGCQPDSLQIEELSNMIGADLKKAKDSIKHAQKVAYRYYDGTFDKPAPVSPEKLLYVLGAILIAEDGRMSDDVVQYTVRTSMDMYFDLSALETPSDFACFVFLIEYFETCLSSKRIPFTPYLRKYSKNNPFVSDRRLATFLRKNWWYGDEEETSDLFMLSTTTPSSASVAGAMLENLNRFKADTEEQNFEA